MSAKPVGTTKDAGAAAPAEPTSPISRARDAAQEPSGPSLASETASIASNASRAHRRGLSGVTPRELKHIDSTLPPHLRQQWKKFSVRSIGDTEAFEGDFVRTVETTLGRSLYNVDTLAAYQAAAIAVRDSLIVKWNRTQQKYTLANPKRVYYLSLEWLMGRALDNALLNLNIKPYVRDGLNDFGFNLEDVLEEEPDAGLGNGGLGRLAACYIDSLSTLEYPAWGYGLRYQYGIFRQRITDGHQVEYPDSWLNVGDPWEVPRHELTFDVTFYGELDEEISKDGKTVRKWLGGDMVEARAYDMPIPGYMTENVNNLRLWSATPSDEFDFSKFNEGKYHDAVAEQVDAHTITSVLYPNENFYEGKELRLKQQYFWVAASLADIVRRFKKSGKPLSQFSDYVAIQLNDTHPTLAIVELMRIFLDKEGLDWHEAWDLVTATFAYTNHTVMSEALEKWPVDVLGNLLPRHLEIIYKINYFFLQEVGKAHPGDNELLSSVSLIEESQPKQVRMAYLAVVGSHKVNGVAELHSDLIKTTIFKDFVRIYGGDKFTNVTNGITPRRWLLEANPKLAALIADKLGGYGYLKQFDSLTNLRKFLNDSQFRASWAEIKKENKARLVRLIEKQQGKKLDINPNALFDIQVKRIHEYKRQQLNIFGVIYRYLVLKSLSKEDRALVLPRVSIFGGKSAPGYYMAKTIIHLINSVAKVINADEETSKYLQVYYVEEYNVSKSEILVAASDISEHISTAGTEASGTSNMKFVLNGGLVIGTVDGANIEIGREVGESNIFFFGHLSEGVDKVRAANHEHGVDLNPKLKQVFDAVEQGKFGNPDFFRSLLDSIRFGDHYLVSADFDAYLATHAKVDVAFADKETWLTKSITAVSQMGFFSSDRAVQEYAETIWNAEPVPVEAYEGEYAGGDPDKILFQGSLGSAQQSQQGQQTRPQVDAARNVPVATAPSGSAGSGSVPAGAATGAAALAAGSQYGSAGAQGASKAGSGTRSASRSAGATPLASYGQPSRGAGNGSAAPVTQQYHDVSEAGQAPVAGSTGASDAQDQKTWTRGGATSDRKTDNNDSARTAAALAAGAGAAGAAGVGASKGTRSSVHAGAGPAAGTAADGINKPGSGQPTSTSPLAPSSNLQATSSDKPQMSAYRDENEQFVDARENPAANSRLTGASGNSTAAGTAGNSNAYQTGSTDPNATNAQRGGITGAAAGAVGAVAAALGFGGSSASHSAHHEHDIAALADEAKAHTTEGHSASVAAKSGNSWNIAQVADEAKGATTEGHVPSYTSTSQTSQGHGNNAAVGAGAAGAAGGAGVGAAAGNAHDQRSAYQTGSNNGANGSNYQTGTTGATAGSTGAGYQSGTGSNSQTGTTGTGSNYQSRDATGANSNYNQAGSGATGTGYGANNSSYQQDGTTANNANNNGGVTGAVTGAVAAAAAAVGLGGAAASGQQGQQGQQGQIPHEHDLAHQADYAKGHTTEGHSSSATPRAGTNWNIHDTAESAKAASTEGYTARPAPTSQTQGAGANQYGANGAAGTGSHAGTAAAGGAAAGGAVGAGAGHHHGQQAAAGTGGSGSGAAGTGATGSGATGTGATGSGATGTGATGTGATGTGAATGAGAGAAAGKGRLAQDADKVQAEGEKQAKKATGAPSKGEKPSTTGEQKKARCGCF